MPACIMLRLPGTVSATCIVNLIQTAASGNLKMPAPANLDESDDEQAPAGHTPEHARYGPYRRPVPFTVDLCLQARGNHSAGAMNSQGSTRLPKTRRNSRIHSGCPGQAAAVTRLPSAYALEKVSFTSPHLPPARSTSGFTAG